MGEEGLVSVQFNQDYTSLGVGTEWGWTLVSLTNPEKLESVFWKDSRDRVHIVERLFSSSLAAVVSLDTPRKLKVFHCKKNFEIASCNYTDSILAVRLNRFRLVVCLEKRIYIHNPKNLGVLHTITNVDSPKGIIALSPNQDKTYLAFPNTTGSIEVFDVVKCQTKYINVRGSDSPVASLAFNTSGSLLAYASDKGTVIQVFDSENGNKLFEFRRGLKRYATIYCMAFSVDDAFLAVSSNTKTVHVFRLQTQKSAQEETKASDSWMSWLTSSLPTQVTDVWTLERAFAWIKLPFQDVKSAVAIHINEGVGRVLIASSEGCLFTYDLNIKEGGECPLSKKQKLLVEENGKDWNYGESSMSAELDKGISVSSGLAEIAVNSATAK